MQTNFTPEQLRDPATAEANAILRSCVHCGFCTATCPTYMVLGDELDSPRGRIYLMKEMLETGRDPDPATVKHIDRCLSCLACMTTCPSGVHYRHLVDHARAYIEERYKRPWSDRMLRRLLAWVLPYPGRFRLALLGAKVGRPFAGWLPDKRLQAMVRMAPRLIPPVSRAEDPQTHPAQGERRMRIGLLTGCAQRALNPGINEAAIRLLTRMGAEVVIPRGQGCCGALTHHMGKEDEARAMAAGNVRAFAEEHAREPLDAIIVTASGCGTTVKDWGHLLARTPDAEAAEAMGALGRDVTEVLARLDLPELPDRGMRVAYHSACSLQHGQRVKVEPIALLKRAGFTVAQPRDSHLCCGSAGTYNILQPEIAGELGRRKAETLEETRPDVIVAGNIGCLMQIGANTGVPILHTVELLDWAYGGRLPATVAEKIEPRGNRPISAHNAA
ncbi:Glycolate dehydrogenase, iron-sulfur subunit GlcF [Rubellimicrobium mesophilum DSM 19309]|uniref:Glycolate oxidase iron-sulfur subunit n=1 Tax=Rubellimicrobium mesophilum DSM 19309 TaxID=442562 RepID=A0A017HT21_9RHOB|nr:glycolate oxidase subunit GlcF [Rubellimicrobium mesophilum]EYD77313.1 Glycolate dehydrogenase, iron-sulfur subunit GlcF [Rubellimicrobium mesophilum DSM 19309]